MSPLLDDETSGAPGRGGPSPEESTGRTGSGDDDLPLDVVFELLSNRRRRLVLRYLREESETTLGDLAEHVASIENEKTREALSSSERKRVYIGLYQSHLPRLDDADVVDFDEDRKTVTEGENARQVVAFLERKANGRQGTRTSGLRGLLGRLLRRVR